MSEGDCICDVTARTNLADQSPPTEETVIGAGRMKMRKAAMRLSRSLVLAFVVAVADLMSVRLAWAVSDCSMLVTLADWGENSTGYIDLASGKSCLFPIRMSGTVSDAEISQKPAHGKLKRLNASTFEYMAKARYKGNDSFVIKASGQGSTASGTSVITVHATIK